MTTWGKLRKTASPFHCFISFSHICQCLTKILAIFVNNHLGQFILVLDNLMSKTISNNTKWRITPHHQCMKTKHDGSSLLDSNIFTPTVKSSAANHILMLILILFANKQRASCFTSWHLALLRPHRSPSCMVLPSLVSKVQISLLHNVKRS